MLCRPASPTWEQHANGRWAAQLAASRRVSKSRPSPGVVGNNLVVRGAARGQDERRNQARAVLADLRKSVNMLSYSAQYKAWSRCTSSRRRIVSQGPAALCDCAWDMHRRTTTFTRRMRSVFALSIVLFYMSCSLMSLYPHPLASLLTLQKSRALRPDSTALSTSLSAAAIWAVADSSNISYSCANPPWLTSLHSDRPFDELNVLLLSWHCRRGGRWDCSAVLTQRAHCMISSMAYRLLSSDQNRALAAVDRGIRRISAL